MRAPFKGLLPGAPEQLDCRGYQSTSPETFANLQTGKTSTDDSAALVRTYLIRNVFSSCFLEQISGFVGDLLVYGARRGWVDFACL